MRRFSSHTGIACAGMQLALLCRFGRRLYATRYFSDTLHVKIDGATSTVGITEYCCALYWPINPVSLPVVGDVVEANQRIGGVEQIEVVFDV